jgi:dihydrofolate synthase/folylpolyglutamate synthase
LEDIAFEKAGIIKKGVPVILGNQAPEVQKVIEKIATSKDAPLLQIEKDWTSKISVGEEMSLRYEDKVGALKLPPPALFGEHQVYNAGQAIAILRHQEKLPINEAAIKAGLDWVRWPARLQFLGGTEYSELLPEGASIWLDGGHNPLAARHLKLFFNSLDSVEQPFYLIIGMMDGKDLKGFVRPFCSLAKAVYAVPIENQGGAISPSQLGATISDEGLSGRIARDVPSALRAIGAETHEEKPPVVLITGSLYLAGIVLGNLGLYPG